jgi:hypothetical protein
MELHGHPDRLIVCVHHPPLAEDAGMALYEALMEHQVAWDEIEAAVVEEHRMLGKPVEGPEVLRGSGGTSLPSVVTRDTTLQHLRSSRSTGCLLRGGLAVATVRLSPTSRPQLIRTHWPLLGCILCFFVRRSCMTQEKVENNIRE